ncbi:MAG: hypothetical protein LBR36_03800 [Bacteroidales bacterium]|jgi:hypothetical protein|nr:hypothetical protein [Bacteroidales bacterium]
MKKILIFSLVLFCVSTIYAQNALEFFYKNDNFKTWFEDDSTLQNAAKKALQVVEFKQLLASQGVNFEKVQNFFHFIDFDNDGDRDLVFYGKINSQHYTIFFSKKDTTYSLTLLEKGIVIEANTPHQNNGLFFTLYNETCCGYYINTLTGYACINFRGVSYFNVTSRALLYKGTVFPSRQLASPVRFKTVKVSDLRIAPKVDAQQMIAGMHSWAGNSLGMYALNATGIILGEFRGQDNTFWYFVRMDNPAGIYIHSNRLTTLEEDIENPQDCFSYGWIKAETVEYFPR